MKYAAYNDYKTSPMAWLNQLPTHWSAASLRWMSKRYAGVGVTLFLDVALKRQLVAHGLNAAGRHHHRFAAPAELVPHVLAEMLDHHLGFLLYVVRMQLLELGQCLGTFLLRDGRVIFHRFHELEPGAVGGVVVQHVEYEPSSMA